MQPQLTGVNVGAHVSAGAFFHPHGKHTLLTTSYDDSLRTWCQKESEWLQERHFKHNNQTGRWISPFKAIWSHDGNSVFCGDMKRGLCCMNPSDGSSLLLESEHMTAISPRLACHMALPVLASGSGSGRVHFWTHAS
jgi:WD repeat-containing protein 76